MATYEAFGKYVVSGEGEAEDGGRRIAGRGQMAEDRGRKTVLDKNSGSQNNDGKHLFIIRNK